ncbi:MAG: serine/threonine protein kinase, partial [Candidatus Latescibacterota bacterium]
MIGRRLSHFRVVSELGAGGMGVVYKAQDERLPRFVALKVLRTEYAQNADRRSRFLREARAAAVVEHPYIAAIHEADEQDGTLFIVMEYVDGATLRSTLKQRAIAVRDILRHGVEIAEGLAKAHEAHVIHRDLKPDNIMISTEGHAKILDFGLAKLVEERDEETSSLLSGWATSSQEVTRRSTRLGTPAYMSPEQVRGRAVDQRSDVFAFGATLFEAATRQAAFHRASVADTLAAILRDAPPSVNSLNPEVPLELEAILEKCLAKDPRDRYEDTRDLVVDLEHLRWKWESGAASKSTGAAELAHTVTMPADLHEAHSTSQPAEVAEARRSYDSRKRRKHARTRWVLAGLSLLTLLALTVVVPLIMREPQKSESQVFYE